MQAVFSVLEWLFFKKCPKLQPNMNKVKITFRKLTCCPFVSIFTFEGVTETLLQTYSTILLHFPCRKIGMGIWNLQPLQLDGMTPEMLFFIFYIHCIIDSISIIYEMISSITFWDSPESNIHSFSCSFTYLVQRN